MGGLTDGIGLVQGVATGIGGFEGATEFVKAASTPVIDMGLVVMMAMSNMSGLGTPDEGQDFGTGAKDFEQIGEALEESGAPGSWTGDGSNAYAGRNELQRTRANTMAELDESVSEVLKEEAEQVKNTRETIDHSMTALTAAIPVALGLKAIPEVGEAVSLAFQATAVLATLPFASNRFEQMANESSENAAKINKAQGGYGDIGSEPDPQSAIGTGEVGVVSTDLRQLSSQQGDVATKIESAGLTTHQTTQNVWFSHGLVCAPTNAAVSSAVESRGSAATKMQSESNVLASRLDSSAGAYDTTDQQQQDNVSGELHPR